MKRLLSAVLFTVATVAIGCGPRASGVVSGKITGTHSGTQNVAGLPTGSITFVNSAADAVASAPVNKDGSYTVEGVVIGLNKVIIEADDEEDDDGNPIPSVRVPDVYQDGETTPLEITVKPGDQTFDIILGPKK